MMGTYVTSSGFVGRTVQQILSTFNSTMQTIFGPSVDTSSEGPTGQLIGVPAAGLGDVWQALQEAYTSMDPAQATGAALDRLCAYTGISRIAAAKTSVNAILYTDAANSGVTIPSGSQARRVRGAVVFSLSADTVIAPGSCQDVYLSFATVPASGTTGVTLTTTFGTFTITMPTATDSTARAIAALELFATAIQASAWGTSTGAPGVAQVWSAGVLQQPAADLLGGNQVTTDVVLRLTNVTTAFGVTLTDTWTMQAVGSQGSFLCNVTGAQTVSLDELTNIVTPQTGWNSVTNLVIGVVGRDVETDTALRIRRKQALGTGLSTEAAIQAYLLNNVSGITAATVTSNRLDTTDSFGAPPHSITATVVGGTTADVAAALWASIPAGIPTNVNANTSGVVVDSQGTSHTLYYNIPVAVQVWVKVLYNLYAEEQFPSDGATEIADAIVTWSLTEFTSGKDVIAPRFLSSIYTVDGLGDVQVTTSLDGVTYVATPLVMSPGQVATISSEHVSVIYSGEI
jgi:uncharacterized phage protein gp47/JayE